MKTYQDLVTVVEFGPIETAVICFGVGLVALGGWYLYMRYGLPWVKNRLYETS